MTPDDQPDGDDLQTPASTWVYRGARDALALPAWVVALSLVGVGGLAQSVGHPVWAAMMSTLVIWAGPAQVIFYGGIAAGMTPLAVAAAVGFSSVRFFPMTVAILPLLRRPGQGFWAQCAAAHFVAVTVWTENLRRLPGKPPPARLPYYYGFAAACILLSTLSTGAGYFLVGALPTPLAAGILFVSPIYFTLSISAGARVPADWLAIALGFALEPPMRALLGDGFDLLGVGLVGGTAAFLFGQMLEGRR
ncbi:branched-chain amino acid permease (azaleucine resistance) [Alsobacter metallidurans]|uniref:Branched-chain amino acid permease (Azaleucine resistance) n=1 Tax=Alsobacter metallidurans TaxID=340221 RepID=A0A917MIK2_9HYPH|nr:AzlC family ABC transporter permease [Alsobacter metallidurans]GGH25025.1 branched-chain amino acid permease (azaleucine resistance) [Alsobacter metallidurans]